MSACRVVAEAGQTMNGSVHTAIEQVRLAADAGAWGYKVQLLSPKLIARADAQKYWADDLGTSTQREAFALAKIVDPGLWREVVRACDAYQIEFLATPFDFQSVLRLAQLDCRTYKIASGDITFRQLIEACADNAETIILSTGASYLYEVERAVGWLERYDVDVVLLACNLAYPTVAWDANLARIETLRKKFKDPRVTVGYSDHTSMPESGMCAAALGSVLNEVHYTLDNDAPDVPDNRIAVNPQRLADYVQASELGATLRGQGLFGCGQSEEPALLGARRSICAARNLPAGHVLAEKDFVYLRPGDMVPPYNAHHYVGKKLKEPVEAEQPIPF